MHNNVTTRILAIRLDYLIKIGLVPSTSIVFFNPPDFLFLDFSDCFSKPSHFLVCECGDNTGSEESKRCR